MIWYVKFIACFVVLKPLDVRFFYNLLWTFLFFRLAPWVSFNDSIRSERTSFLIFCLFIFSFLKWNIFCCLWSGKWKKNSNSTLIVNARSWEMFRLKINFCLFRNNELVSNSSRFLNYLSTKARRVSLAWLVETDHLIRIMTELIREIFHEKSYDKLTLHDFEFYNLGFLARDMTWKTSFPKTNRRQNYYITSTVCFKQTHSETHLYHMTRRRLRLNDENY